MDGLVTVKANMELELKEHNFREVIVQCLSPREG